MAYRGSVRYGVGGLILLPELNAGDQRLYVGGASINLEFAKAIAGRPEARFVGRYDKLHQALVRLSIANQSRIVRASDCPKLRNELRHLNLSECYGKAGPPESLSKDPKGHSGATFLSIFAINNPMKHELNKAMLYAVGPKGEGCRGPKERRSNTYQKRHS